MRVLLTSAYSQGVALSFLREAARRDRFGVHEVTSDPDGADAILFVENLESTDPFYRRLVSEALVPRFGQRVFMYNECDAPYCALPGLYASMPRRAFDARRQVAFTYLFRPNEFIPSLFARQSSRDLLFSFMGAPTHRIRRRLFALADSEAHIENTATFSIWADTATEELRRRKERYADVLARSRFVLCPRGAGTSSYRLFETMEAGRAPVVISDQWVEPEGPDWESFLVRVPESELDAVPQTLRALDGEAADRGQAARTAWEEWFAPDVVFHRAAEAIARLMSRSNGELSNGLPLTDTQFLRVWTSRALRVNLARARGLVHHLRAPHAFSVRD